MSPQIDLIIKQIERLDEADRIVLELRLQELAETEWKRAADEARAAARKQNIDQQKIDDAVNNLRYGSGRSSSTPMRVGVP